MIVRSSEKKYSHFFGSTNLSSSSLMTLRYDGELEGIETVYIVEPQLHNSVCVAQIRTGWPIAGNEALNVMAHIALHVGLTCEKGMSVVRVFGTASWFI